jgi:hypothetical protein
MHSISFNVDAIAKHLTWLTQRLGQSQNQIGGDGGNTTTDNGEIYSRADTINRVQNDDAYDNSKRLYKLNLPIYIQGHPTVMIAQFNLPIYLELLEHTPFLSCLNTLGTLSTLHPEIKLWSDPLKELVAWAGEVVKYMDESLLRRHLWIWTRLGKIIRVRCQRVQLVGRRTPFWVILRNDEQQEVMDMEIE